MVIEEKRRCYTIRIVLGLLFMIIGLWYLLQAIPETNIETATEVWVFFFLFWAVGLPLLVYGWRAVLRNRDS